MLGGYRTNSGDWARIEREFHKATEVEEWSREDIANLNRINQQFGLDTGVFIS